MWLLSTAAPEDPSLWTQLFGAWGACLAVLAGFCLFFARAWLASLARERALYDRVIDQAERSVPVLEEAIRELRRIDPERRP